MYGLRQDNPTFVGGSHELVGAEQGSASVSEFQFYGKPALQKQRAAAGDP
jgi:hypothetical protein